MILSGRKERLTDCKITPTFVWYQTRSFPDRPPVANRADSIRGALDRGRHASRIHDLEGWGGVAEPSGIDEKEEEGGYPNG